MHVVVEGKTLQIISDKGGTFLHQRPHSIVAVKGLWRLDGDVEVEADSRFILYFALKENIKYWVEIKVYCSALKQKNYVKNLTET